MKIRQAMPDDLPAIFGIYNDAVRNSTATFDTEPRDDDEQRRWYEEHDAYHPVLVAEQADAHGTIVGWGSLSEWSDRRAYSRTLELSVYVDAEARGKGIGSRIIEAMLDRGRAVGAHVILSRVTGENETSMYLHRKFGFEFIGTMREVGYKFGRYLDVHLYQLILNSTEYI